MQHKSLATLTSLVFVLGASSACIAVSPPVRHEPTGAQQGSPYPGSPDSRDYRDQRDYRDDGGYRQDGYDDDDYYYDDGNGYRSSPRQEVGFFYEELSPYGDWLLSRDYGWAWFPRNVDPSWRPYSEGRWVNTNYGWTWASYEPFGWATYHYGRWTWDNRIGWLWIPDTVWGPAWVSWQYGGGYIGWAPLPPSVGFDVRLGINLGIHVGGLDLRFGLRPDSYRFVQERSFLDARLSTQYVPSARNVTIINHTTNITNYTYVDNRVVNRGVDVDRIERATGRQVHELRVGTSNNRTHSDIDRTTVSIYRPNRQKLESVRTRPQRDAGPAADATPRGTREQPSRNRNNGDRPSGNQRATPATPDARVLAVAPRVNRTGQVDVKQLDRDDRRAHEQLERYQAAEKKRLEKEQSSEISRTPRGTARPEVEKNQQAERKALEQEQKTAAEQLEARQQTRRRALVAKPAENATDKPKATDTEHKPADRRRKPKK